MKALIYVNKEMPLVYRDVEPPPAAEGQVIVRLKAAALNHRDNWILKGLYPGLQDQTILGADGAGIVDDREVMINPGVNWGSDSRFPSRDFQILGMPEDGTFAEQIAVAPDRLHDKPAHLSLEQAAALPLAGLTAYRALISRCEVQAGEQVLISGVGGGVALFACQFAVALGANVYVTSSSSEKVQAAVALGAKGGAIYTEPEWHKPFGKETGGFDVIIDSAGGAGFADLVKLTRPGARIALYGGTRGNWQNVSPQLVFFRQISIFGSTMGSDEEFAQMVSFVNEYKIEPVVDSIFDLSDGAAAIDRMDQGRQFGKIVLRI
ncbi:zinc-binding dehydrogenase [Chloroflexi bacterium TSY]|nr:zinc-binding dehydrogenase [Chloroflexi bacterium TSY]